MRKLLRIVQCAMAAGAAALAGAQSAIHVKTQSASSKEAWVSEDFPTSEPTDVTKNNQANFEMTASSKSGYLCVLDLGTGNLAVKPLKGIKDSVALSASDFGYIATIRIKVEHDGDPITAANITLNDGKRTASRLLDPSSKGSATFFAVKPGTLKAEIAYNSKGANKTLKESTEIGLTHDSTQPLWVIAVSDPVETIAPAPLPGAETASASSAGQTGAGTAPKEAIRPEENPVGKGIVILLAIGLFLAGALYVFRWIQKNPAGAQSAFQKIGVPIPDPDPNAAATGAPMPYTPPAPQPAEKIILQGADPIPLGGSPVTLPAASATSVVAPRFVGAHGAEIPIPDGTSQLGREAGLGLSMPNESSLSRRHAEIRRSGSSIFVRDLGSTNGTFVNGVKLTGEVSLRPGDTVQFGSAQFRYET